MCKSSMECSSTGTFERISQKRIKTNKNENTVIKFLKTGEISIGSCSKGGLQWGFGFLC